MNTPPLLLGGTLLFWGWLTGFFAVGAVLGVLIEIPRAVKFRWTFAQADFDRLWNLCAALFIGSAAYLFINEGTLTFGEMLSDSTRRPEAIAEKGRAALVWFQWAPMLFFPFAVACAFSETPQVDVSTFSWFLRRRRQTEQNLDRMRINVAFPYFALVIFAACAAPLRTKWFYPLLAGLLGWAFASRRPHRLPAPAWVVVFAVVVMAGHLAHSGIFRLYRNIEELNASWFSRFASLELDTRHTRTSIGSIGRLKLSREVVLRLFTDGQPPPSLLREATYNGYRAGYWHNSNKEFGRTFDSSTNITTWIFSTNQPPRQSVTIGRYLRRGSGILAVPSGLAWIDSLPVVDMETNLLGAIRVRGGPGLALYDARYTENGPSFDSRPSPDDLRMHDDVEPAVEQIAQELGLHDVTDPERAMQLVAGFLRKNFTYTSLLTKGHAATSNETALTRFLLKERSGHCEYFASATALLLRKAGVPTRYAIGYSVQEGKGDKWIVRERHGHAWTLVYYDGKWHDFDTTPADWNSREPSETSWLAPLKDLGSELWFQFSKWRWTNTEWRQYVVWIPVPLTVLALATFFLKQKWRPMRRKNVADERHDWPGLDSELYEIERLLRKRGLERRPAENWVTWLERVEPQAGIAAQLRPLVQLHSRYRFDPRGLSAEERTALREGALHCLQVLRSRS